MRRTIIIFVLIIFSAIQSSAQIDTSIPRVRIGILTDGMWSRNDEVFSSLKTEISSLVKGEFNVIFPEDKMIDGQWNISKIRSGLTELLNDPDVDIVIAGGEIASRVAAFTKNIPKPLIAPVAFNAELQGMPLKNGTSGEKNLSYITYTSTLDQDILAFKKLINFSNAVLVLNDLYYEEVESEFLRLRLPTDRTIDGVSVKTLPLGQDIDQVIDKLPENVDAVMLSPLHHLSDEKIRKLINELNNKGLPVLSLFDEQPIEFGALMGTVPKDFFLRLSRRVALNLQSILLGEKPENIPVKFPVNDELVINMATAREMNIYPSWSLMAEARIINAEKEPSARRLTLFDVISEALIVNLSVAAKKDEVLAGEKNVSKARANLLPQLEVSASGVLIDKDRAESSFGSQAERTISGTATLSQIIFDEKAWANLRISDIQQDILEYENEQLKLDIILEATTAYLNVLQSKASESIQIENLNKSISNLEIAQFRKDVGYAGPAEVYRWESEIASSRKSVIEVNAQRNIAEIDLNRLLNRPLEEAFDTEEAMLTNLVDIIGRSRIMKYFSNKWYFKVFRSFLVEESFTYSPELKIVNAGIEAKQRALSAAKNSIFLPTIGLQAQLNNTFYRGGAGSTVEPIVIPNLGSFALAQEPKDLNWNIGVSLSLPLFSGGARYADIAQAKLQISQFETEKKSVQYQIEQRVRSAVHKAGASFAGMKEAANAEDASNKNLDLVVDAYSRGVISITELIDAQSAALTAKLLASSSRYTFLNDLLNVQRAIGRFLDVLSREERNDFYYRLEEYFKENLKNN